MPWKEWSVVDQRTRFIEDWLTRSYTVTDLSRSYGISRETAYKWIGRFKREGRSGLVDRSRAPYRRWNRTPETVRARIVEAKLAHQNWGPKKVMDHLRRLQPDGRWPADSTAGEILKEAGLVRPRRRRRRVGADVEVFRDCDGPNRVWSADFKGQFRLGDGTLCYPLTVTDNHSRYLLACRGLARPDGASTRCWMEWAFREYGLPEAIRTDNGAPFASTAAGGITRLSRWWIRLGIKPERTEPGSPHQNGRHERMHRTLKAETAAPPSHSLVTQQIRFAAFGREYNEERSHEGLGRRRPVEVYRPSPQRYPERIPEVVYDDGVTVRSVRHNGEIKFQGALIYVAETLAKDRVSLIEVAEGLWEVRYSFHLLGYLREPIQRLEPARAWHNNR